MSKIVRNPDGTYTMIKLKKQEGRKGWMEFITMVVAICLP